MLLSQRDMFARANVEDKISSVEPILRRHFDRSGEISKNPILIKASIREGGGPLAVEGE